MSGFDSRRLHRFPSPPQVREGYLCRRQSSTPQRTRAALWPNGHDASHSYNAPDSLMARAPSPLWVREGNLCRPPTRRGWAAIEQLYELRPLRFVLLHLQDSLPARPSWFRRANTCCPPRRLSHITAMDVRRNCRVLYYRGTLLSDSIH